MLLVFPQHVREKRRRFLKSLPIFAYFGPANEAPGEVWLYISIMHQTKEWNNWSCCFVEEVKNVKLFTHHARWMTDDARWTTDKTATYNRSPESLW